ncbi:hypothetical protein HKX48_005896 [Thoreauomyces humboldtii]|nr:hypothetical protein HKX48_005896 [Thoreauomyces humboldtii]
MLAHDPPALQQLHSAGVSHATSLPPSQPIRKHAKAKFATSIAEVPIMEYSIDHDNLMVGVSAVLRHFMPSWDVAADVTFVQCTAGITNKLVRCIHKQSTSVLVRTYGKGSGVLIDRHQEMLNLLTLSNLGLSPPLYGRFDNGLVYGFISGTPFSVADMSDPHKALLVAGQLARWHQVQIPGMTPSPKLFSTMWKWLEEVPSSYTNPAKDAKFHEFVNLDALKEELRDLQQALEALQSPVTFCHNDLLSGNIVYNAHTDECSFIDYEYGSFSYRAFDIGNHFCEYAGFDCDWALYPSKEVQIPWLRAYLEAGSSEAVSEAEVEALFREVSKFSLAAHVFWSIWALVQAEISDLDFDYLDYAITRLSYMRVVRDQYLAL